MTDHPSGTGSSEPQSRGPAYSLACIELVELVTEYLDDVLVPPDRERIERHLAECDGCHTYLEQIRHMIAIMGHLEPEAVPPAAIDRLLAAFRAARTSQ